MLLNFLNPLRAFFEALPWLGVLLVLARAGLAARRLAALPSWWACSACLRAATGLWEQAMQTVYLCGVSALVACAARHSHRPLGVAQRPRVGRSSTPIIDTLQTCPSFCFIIPVVMLFRVGDFTAMIATVAFAIVPAIRYTNHGIRQVPPALIEAGKVSGCTRWQLFRACAAAAGAARDHAGHQPDDPARASA